MSSEYTIEFSYKVNKEDNAVNIGMIEYTSLFAMGNTLTVDDIGEEIFEKLNTVITNNTPFYLNKWKSLSETEQYMNPLKFELSAVKADENKNPIYYDFMNTVMTTNDEGKLVVGAHTLRYDVLNQTLTGGIVTNN
jgi:myosin-crossreactive antigen